MLSHAPQSGKRVICPRCGYDQRGVMATWNDSCPLTTHCAECGLELEWRLLLNDRLAGPLWSIEHANTRADFARRMPRTIAAAFVPPVMWRSMRIEHEIRSRRLFATIAILLIAAIAAAHCGFRASLVSYLYFSYLPQISASTSANVGIELARSIVTPWSSRSGGTITFTNGWNLHPTPSALPDFVLRRFPLGGWQRHFRTVACCAIFSMSVACISPLVFAVLPHSRRCAKVQWRQIFRVAAYSAFPITIVLVWLGIILTIWPWRPAVILGAMNTTCAFVYIGVPVFMTVFWHSAIRHYLRMTQALAVALSVVVITTLASCAITFYSVNPLTFTEIWYLVSKAFD
jgi:hypothetical protein